MGGDLRVELDPRALTELEQSPELTALLQQVGELVADAAQGNARRQGIRETGEGIASIQALVARDAEGIHVDVSFTADHFYMGFAETGTEDQAARPFLRPALDSTRL